MSVDSLGGRHNVPLLLLNHEANPGTCAFFMLWPKSHRLLWSNPYSHAQERISPPSSHMPLNEAVRLPQTPVSKEQLSVDPHPDLYSDGRGAPKKHRTLTNQSNKNAVSTELHTKHQA